MDASGTHLLQIYPTSVTETISIPCHLSPTSVRSTTYTSPTLLLNALFTNSLPPWPHPATTHSHPLPSSSPTSVSFRSLAKFGLGTSSGLATERMRASVISLDHVLAPNSSMTGGPSCIGSQYMRSGDCEAEGTRGTIVRLDLATRHCLWYRVGQDKPQSYTARTTPPSSSEVSLRPIPLRRYPSLRTVSFPLSMPLWTVPSPRMPHCLSTCPLRGAANPVDTFGMTPRYYRHHQSCRPLSSDGALRWPAKYRQRRAPPAMLFEERFEMRIHCWRAWRPAISALISSGFDAL